MLHENIPIPQLGIGLFLSSPFMESFGWPESKNVVGVFTWT